MRRRLVFLSLLIASSGTASHWLVVIDVKIVVLTHGFASLLCSQIRYFIAERSSIHASSHCRRASAQTRQCSCVSAWRSHSSAAGAARLATGLEQRLRGGGVVLRLAVSTRPVTSQISAQSRLRRMHLRSSAPCPPTGSVGAARTGRRAVGAPTKGSDMGARGSPRRTTDCRLHRSQCVRR